MDDDELRADQKENTERTAYKCALEMMMNILVSYFNVFHLLIKPFSDLLPRSTKCKHEKTLIESDSRL